MNTKETDILKDNPTLKKMPYELPDGYFEEFKHSLDVRKKQEVTVTPIWKKTPTYIAIAAIFAIFIVAGGFFVEHNRRAEELSEYDYIVYSDDLTFSIFDEYTDQYADAMAITQNETIEYLIYSGVEVEELEY